MNIRFYSILSNYNNDISLILYLNILVLGYRLHGVLIRSDRKMSVTNNYESSICVLFDSVQIFTPEMMIQIFHDKRKRFSHPFKERHVAHCVYIIIFIVIISTLSGMINTKDYFIFIFPPMEHYKITDDKWAKKRDVEEKEEKNGMNKMTKNSNKNVIWRLWRLTKGIWVS